MTSSFGLTQALTVSHLRPQTIKSLRFVEIKIVMTNPPLYSCKGGEERVLEKLAKE